MAKSTNHFYSDLWTTTKFNAKLGLQSLACVSYNKDLDLSFKSNIKAGNYLYFRPEVGDSLTININYSHKWLPKSSS